MFSDQQAPGSQRDDKKFKPFSGEGHRLGSADPNEPGMFILLYTAI